MFVIATPGTFDIDFVNYSIIDGGVYITVGLLRVLSLIALVMIVFAVARASLFPLSTNHDQPRKSTRIFW